MWRAPKWHRVRTLFIFVIFWCQDGSRPNLVGSYERAAHKDFESSLNSKMVIQMTFTQNTAEILSLLGINRFYIQTIHKKIEQLVILVSPRTSRSVSSDEYHHQGHGGQGPGGQGGRRGGQGSQQREGSVGSSSSRQQRRRRRRRRRSGHGNSSVGMHQKVVKIFSFCSLLIQKYSSFF